MRITEVRVLIEDMVEDMTEITIEVTDEVSIEEMNGDEKTHHGIIQGIQGESAISAELQVT